MGLGMRYQRRNCGSHAGPPDAQGRRRRSFGGARKSRGGRGVPVKSGPPAAPRQSSTRPPPGRRSARRRRRERTGTLEPRGVSSELQGARSSQRDSAPRKPTRLGGRRCPRLEMRYRGEEMGPPTMPSACRDRSASHIAGIFDQHFLVQHSRYPIGSSHLNAAEQQHRISSGFM